MARLTGRWSTMQLTLRLALSLALLNGGWMAFDGARAVAVGDLWYLPFKTVVNALPLVVLASRRRRPEGRAHVGQSAVSNDR